MTSEIPTCRAELSLTSGTRSEWCTLPYAHHGPHTNSTGVRWKDPFTPSPHTGPTVHKVDKCANMLCSNQPGEGAFRVFSILLARHPVALALCAPCGETVAGATKWGGDQ